MNLLIALLFSFNAQAKQRETQTVPVDKIQSLTIQNNLGDIDIESSDLNQIDVTTMKWKFTEKCKVTVHPAGNNLTIKIEGEPSESCKVGLTVKAPPTLALDLKSGDGDISVKGTQGPLKFATTAGDVTVKGAVSSVVGSTTDGDIKFRYSKLPEKADLNLSAGAGDILFNVPEKSVLSYKYETKAGKVRRGEGIVDSDEAGFKIKAKTEKGNLKILGPNN